jgi:uncharacterized protein
VNRPRILAWTARGGLRRPAALALIGAVALVALGGPGAAGAQVATPTPGTPTVPTVSVSGQGRVKVEPDTASVVAGIDVLRPTLDAAQTEATTQMEAIIAAIEAAGIAEDDIQTTNYSVSIIRAYDEQGMPAEIQGYQVSNQVAVTIRDTDQLGQILDALVAAGANNIWGISFYVEDTTAAASQARRQAVEDARTKAGELADAAGMSVGRVVSISESFGPPPIPQVFEGRAADMAQGAGAAVPIQPGTTEVIVDVHMTFELE